MSKSINQHLSLDNRNDILKYVKEGFSLRKIASIINCSPSTITRELKKRRIIKNLIYLIIMIINQNPVIVIY